VVLDWGAIPASYGWVFPKGDRLTVGVIAARGQGEPTKAYLREFVDRLGLAGHEVLQDSGHLTRCRADASPLRAGQVILTGDAAGLLDPWTREGISFALRSGTLAGEYAAKGDPDGYVAAINATLVPEMHAGHILLRAFTRHTGALHRGLATARGWRAFVNICRSDVSLSGLVSHPAARVALALLNRF
jgi:flavin-dependent dehydrogenase